MKPNVLIEASAGTGKTQALAERLIELIRLGVKPQEIVALTFSRAAAGEIFERFVTLLAEKIEKGEVDAALLREVIATQHLSQIGTLDSFLMRIVRSFPLELGIQGPLEMMDDYRAAAERSRVSFAILRRTDAAELPITEATRYLVNRGMGLLLARGRGEGDFAKVNVNKAVLGAGDAILVSEGRYAWDIRERARRLANPLYDRAVAFKLHPVGEVASWDEAAQLWREAVDRVFTARGRDVRRRKLRHALRWLKRRRTVGSLGTFGMDTLTRILLPMRELMRHPGWYLRTMS